MDSIMFRGSRKHVLDWTARPEFCEELLALVAPVDVRISARSAWMPRGYRAPDEARLGTFGPLFLPDSAVWPTLRKWWLAHARRANTPNWDIAMGCEVEGRPGLVLVEAKANVPELTVAGKPVDSTTPARSGENHRQIGLAINQACVALQRINVTTAISRDSHYQLSNRVAFAWKLASLGVPTVLVYLGFLGDEGIRDAGAPFTDSAHWEATFAEYAHAMVPKDLFERRIDCGAAPAWFQVRSKHIIEVSPTQLSKPALEPAPS
jgi:hypothetical protein